LITQSRRNEDRIARFHIQERRDKARLIKELLGIVGTLILLIEIYRFIHRYLVRYLLEKKKKEKRTRKAAVLRIKSERDCRFCCEGMGKTASCEARKTGLLAVAEREGRTEEESSDRRVLLPNKLRVLCNYGRSDPHACEIWEAWKT
jgi:hypothetical protein